MSRILIADDSRFQVELLKRGLGKGFEFVTAGTSAETKILVLDRAPEIIILDLTLPDGSGLELLKWLKRSPKTKSIPVIIVSATDDSAIRDMATADGASDFFQKPIDLDQLGRRISQLLTP